MSRGQSHPPPAPLQHQMPQQQAPHNLDAERSVLGAILLDTAASELVFDGLTSADFYNARHARIFSAMHYLHEHGEPVDEVTVSARLAATGQRGDGVMAYVASLTERVPTAANVAHYAAIVKRCAVARKLVDIASQARNAALSTDIVSSLERLRGFEDLCPAEDKLRAGLGLAPAAQHEELTWPTLPPAALHGVAGDYVRALTPHTEADAVAILAQFLVAFGNMVGRGPHFVAEADQHYTNEFIVLVGDTAKGRKGSSWGHIRRLFARIDEDWAHHRIRSGLSSGEGLVHAVRDPSADNNQDDTRLLALEGEFAQALSVAARDGNTLSPQVRNAWDGVALGNLTKNNPDRASAAHISIIGHITRTELKRRLSAVDIANGFANRFIWLCVRRSKLLPEGGRLPNGEVLPFVMRLERAARFAREVGEMQRDAAARAAWCDAYRRLSAAKLGIIDALTCRAEAHVMRLACLYALLDLSAQVRHEHLQAALGLWAYAETSCRHIFGDAVGDPAADTILEALRNTPTGLTRTEISALFRRNKNASEIRKALARLETQHLATSETVHTRGAPSEVWSAVLPEVDLVAAIEEAHAAEKARGRRSIISSSIVSSSIISSSPIGFVGNAAISDDDDVEPHTTH